MGAPIVTRSGPAKTIAVSSGATTASSRAPVGVSVRQGEPLVRIIGGQQGVAGEQGPPGVPDFVWPIKPDSTLTYTGDDLTRIDYADGTFKDLTYAGGLLVTVSGLNLGGDTITKTLAYDGSDRLESVTTVVT